MLLVVYDLLASGNIFIDKYIRKDKEFKLRLKDTKAAIGTYSQKWSISTAQI